MESMSRPVNEAERLSHATKTSRTVLPAKVGSLSSSRDSFLALFARLYR